MPLVRKQCNVIFQSALLGLLHGRQRDGRLRELATGPSGSTRTTGTTGAKQPRENSSADGLPSKRPKPTRRGGRGRGQSLPQEQIGNVVTMLASLCLQQEDALNRIRLETSHTLHQAQQGQGAVLKALYNAGTAWQVKRTAGSQYRPSEWSSLGCFWPKLRPGSNCSPKTMQQ